MALIHTNKDYHWSSILLNVHSVSPTGFAKTTNDSLWWRKTNKKLPVCFRFGTWLANFILLFESKLHRCPIQSNLESWTSCKFVDWWIGNSDGKSVYWTFQLGKSRRVYNVGACSGLTFILKLTGIQLLFEHKVDSSQPGLTPLHYLA